MTYLRPNTIISITGKHGGCVGIQEEIQQWQILMIMRVQICVGMNRAGGDGTENAVISGREIGTTLQRGQGLEPKYRLGIVRCSWSTRM